MLRTRSLVLAISALMLMLSTPASALTIDFEGQANGESGGVGIANGFNYNVGGINVHAYADVPPPGNHLGLAIFDSRNPGPNSAGADPDLLTDPLAGTGNILILQNNNFAAKTGNVFDTPNDDEQGGQFFFDFSTGVELLSIGLIDVNQGGMMSVILRDSGIGTRTFMVPDGWNGDVDQNPSVGYQDLDLTDIVNNQIGIGNGLPATGSDANGFNPLDVVQLEITFDGSAAVDNLTFIPEPGTALLLGAGLAGLGLRGRRA